MTERQEARLYARAARERWPIPHDEISKTVERVCYLRDYGEKESTQIAAVNAITQMMSQNQKDEHKLVDAHISAEHARLDEIAADLGVDAGLIESFARKTSGGTGGATE